MRLGTESGTDKCLKSKKAAKAEGSEYPAALAREDTPTGIPVKNRLNSLLHHTP